MSDSDCFEVNLRNAKTTEVSEAIMHLKAKSKAIISFHVRMWIQLPNVVWS